eukprot:TRINITY_DN55_c0_g1_i1.p1 TRINITY_DN55_c0_g1~~TRINITY_DN55_c0_g1_i1.p1  ORF type:complete len:227 (-),score=65.28 TRINITY_DN55_c0_g1_i1:113-793(-)
MQEILIRQPGIYAYYSFYSNDVKDLTFPNGDRFVGQFNVVDGVRTGKGMYKYSCGDVYIGSFENNLPHGFGELLFATGTKYTGIFEFGKFQGAGRLDDSAGVYIGYFVDGKQEDVNGMIEYLSGDVFMGQYQNGKRNGYGTYVHANGDYYKGMYRNGLKEGRGEERTVDGETYIGEFKGGRREGRGKWISADGIFHEGEFLNGAFLGFNSSSNDYEGEFIRQGVRT